MSIFLADFEIGEGDLLSEIHRYLLDDQTPPQPLDLTNATVTFTLTSIDGGTPKIDAAPAAVIGPAVNGVVGYIWQGTDTDTPGWYLGEFRVTFGDGRKARVPTVEKLKIRITRKA